MTDIRTKGLKGRELDVHLAELEDLAGEEIGANEEDNEQDLLAARRTIAFLRKEVADLQELAAIMHGARKNVAARSETQLWFRIGVAFAATVSIGALLKLLRPSAFSPAEDRAVSQFDRFS